MSYIVKIDDCIDLMRVLSDEVRKKYVISNNEISSPYIEKEFNLKIKYSDLLYNKEENPSTVTFVSEAHYTFLMLKYYERTQKGSVAS